MPRRWPSRVRRCVSLGEGWTPLVRRDWEGVPVWFKLESQMPTGSFKDRGTAVMINHLLEVGVGPIHEDSSGNAGVVDRDLRRRRRHPVPHLRPGLGAAGKLVQIAAAGADLRPISGTRQAVTEAALAAADESFYASHNWHPYFIEGTQTLAFELWEQLGFRVPDNILVPTGYGSNILGLERGFDALERPARSPAGRGCSPCRRRIARPSQRPGRPAPTRWCRSPPHPTIADGIATMRPVRTAAGAARIAPFAWRGRRRREDEIAPAVLGLGRLGLFVEPTAATAGAALTRLLADGTIEPGETTVAVLTGHGLKAADRIAAFAGIPAG